MELARDLGSADVWADSLERSLARRGRPRRASLELGRLNPARDLSDADTVNESVVYWRTRRAASASSTFTAPAVGGASVLALLAATTLPALAGGARSPSGRSAHHRSRAAGHATPSATPAQIVLHHAVSSKPVFATTAATAQAHSTPASYVLGTPKSAAPARPVVYGSVSHGDLRDAQRLLGLSVDNVLGPQTGAAIRAFQQAHGLAADGNVGPATWDALKAAHAHPAAAAAPVTNPAPAASGSTVTVHQASVMQPVTSTPSDVSAVTALQQKLAITTDGNYGTETVAAVEAFQSAHGLTADGVVGASTRAALGLGDGPTLQATTGSATTGGAASPGTGAVSTASPAPGASSTASSDATAAPAATSPAPATPATLTAATSTATTPSNVTTALSQMISAGDQIATLPYIWGGGHGSFVSPGYDCSGSVSYVLHAGGLLSAPEDSGSLESYGAPGPGQYVTIYADAGHTWMTINGRRFDTIARAETGSRWSNTPGDPTGMVVRHPIGF